MTSLQIRKATSVDAALILRFITDLAIYEKAEHEVLAVEADIRKSLFGESATAKAVICEQVGEPIGFAVYFFSYSTWLGKNGLFLEDLFVAPASRGTGAGKALLKHLAAIAVENDCARVEWNVLDWNEPAIQFYQAIGAQPQSEWIGYRLAGAALQNFAKT